MKLLLCASYSVGRFLSLFRNLVCGLTAYTFKTCFLVFRSTMVIQSSWNYRKKLSKTFGVWIEREKEFAIIQSLISPALIWRGAGVSAAGRMQKWLCLVPLGLGQH